MLELLQFERQDNMKKHILGIILIITVLMMFTGCTEIDMAELPEPTPEPTPEPEIDLDMYYEPTPSVEIKAPKTIEELNELIDMNIAAPSSPAPGMELRSLGYDGKNEGALRYQDKNGSVLLYTFHTGIDESEAQGYSSSAHISGFDVLLSEKDSLYSGAYWVKGGCTYKIFAEPSLTQEDITNAVKAMILVAKTSEDSPDVLSEGTLEQIVGFKISSPKNLPDEYVFARMYAMNNETAITIYESEKLRVTFAQCEGDIYPDRTVTQDLPNGDAITTGDITVETYCAENGCCIAEWQKDGFGYSITVTDKKNNPIDIKEKKMLELINCFMNIEQT